MSRVTEIRAVERTATHRLWAPRLSPECKRCPPRRIKIIGVPLDLGASRAAVWTWGPPLSASPGLKLASRPSVTT